MPPIPFSSKTNQNLRSGKLFVFHHSLEEKEIVKEFPKEYAEYRKRTWF